MAVFDTYLAVMDPTPPPPRPPAMTTAGLRCRARGTRPPPDRPAVDGARRQQPCHPVGDPDPHGRRYRPTEAFGVSATDTDIYLLCPDAVECYGYDGVQNWVHSDLALPPAGGCERRKKPLLFKAAAVGGPGGAGGQLVAFGAARFCRIPGSRKLPLIF